MLFADTALRVINLTFDDADMRLRPDYSLTFRDFSGTTRTGEFGQAVAWAYMAHFTAYPYCVDYGEAMSLLGRPRPSDGPDFLFLHRTLPNFIIAECKGTTAAKGGPSMKAGLRQCDAGEAAMGLAHPVRKIASLARFSATDRARLTFRDPEGRGDLTPVEYKKLLRLALAPWFQAARNDDASRLREGAPLRIPNAPDSTGFIEIGETDEVRCYVRSNLYRRLATDEESAKEAFPTSQATLGVQSGDVHALPDDTGVTLKERAKELF